MQQQNEKIIAYYDATLSTYEKMWYSPKSLALHFGYYDKNTKTHAASLVKINEVLSKIANIQATDKVLDAGCGVGGSAIWLAKNYHCKVIGININSAQLQKAIIYASDNEVSDLVSFEKQDYTATSFKDKDFSVVWAQESFSHTQQKQKLINETYRILDDNGRLIMAEYLLVKTENLNKKNQKIYNKWIDGHAMSGLLSKSEYQKILQEAGFKNIEFLDITKNVAPSLRKLYRMSKTLAQIINIIFKIGFANKLKKNILWKFKNIEASYNQYLALKAGLWKYVVIITYK